MKIKCLSDLMHLVRLSKMFKLGLSAGLARLVILTAKDGPFKKPEPAPVLVSELVAESVPALVAESAASPAALVAESPAAPAALVAESVAAPPAEAHVDAFPQATCESANLNFFFECFPNYPLREHLADKVVLDFGCGYGGKTVDYALEHHARMACGIEPHANMIEKCQAYAETRHAATVEFKICPQNQVPYPDAYFDVVVTHDVLEHVEDPRVSVAELWRVMKPGALAFCVFPVYFGAESHHLDYIVKLRGIHWVFSARALIKAVNSILEEYPHITGIQPEPLLSFDKRHRVLPNLNGLSGRHLNDLFRRFEMVSFERRPLMWWRPEWEKYLGPICRSAWAPSIIQDMATNNISCILRKPG